MSPAVNPAWGVADHAPAAGLSGAAHQGTKESADRAASATPAWSATSADATTGEPVGSERSSGATLAAGRTSARAAGADTARVDPADAGTPAAATAAAGTTSGESAGAGTAEAGTTDVDPAGTGESSAEPDAWLDTEPDAPMPSIVRAYTWTAGRTTSNHRLDIETLVSTTEDSRWQPPSTRVEHQQIADLCHETKSVAEVSALLALPLGVAKVLLGDMAELGLITVHESIVDDGADGGLMLMERVLSGLHRL